MAKKEGFTEWAKRELGFYITERESQGGYAKGVLVWVHNGGCRSATNAERTLWSYLKHCHAEMTA